MTCKTPNAANHNGFVRATAHALKLTHANCAKSQTQITESANMTKRDAATLHTNTRLWNLKFPQRQIMPTHGRKFRAAQNAVLQTRLQTKLQTRLQTWLRTNNAGNQTHSAATLFSAMSSPHTSSSSSKFSNLSPPRQDFQTWRDGTPIYVIGNVHLLVGLADFVNEVVANAEWLHVSSLLGQ